MKKYTTTRPLSHFFRLASITLLLSTTISTHAATAGPGTWSSEQTWAADSQNGGNLKGYFYWPASQPAHANGKRALILALHGCSMTASGDVINSSSDGGFNLKSVADQYGAVVLAPNATGNVAYSHCWDYYGTSHSRTSGHTGVLLDLVSRFKNNSSYEIDPNQVYVVGFSSGGGEALVLGCLAPDIFAGVGAAAGPGVGTSSSQYSSVPYNYTASTAQSNCNSLAGSNSGSFSTQIAGTVWGTSDYTVAQGFGAISANAFRNLYGGTFTAQSSESISGGGTNTNYKDSSGRIRTHQISVSGLAHAWPAGSGGQNTHYVSSAKINYGAWVTAWFFANNIRAGATSTTTTTSVGSTTTTTSGSATTTSTSATTTTTASTTTTTNAAGECYNASNYSHYLAGRAHLKYYTYALANGSNQNMGFNNAYVMTKLRKTGSNYYVIDSSCP